MIPPSLEEKLLWACCRSAWTSPSDESFFLNTMPSINYEKLFILADQHRLILIVNSYFVQKYKAQLPLKVVAQFTEETKKIVFTQLSLISTLCKINRIFSENQLTYAFLKGPLLNQQLFGDALLRYSNDIDVLVLPENIPVAHACLIDLGYQSDTPLKTMQALAKRRWMPGKKDALYYHPQLPFRIELHWKLEENHSYAPFKDWSLNLSTSTFQQQHFPVLNDNINLTYLCLHASKHNWTRARWLWDIVFFLEKKGITPEKLLHTAKEYALTTPVYEAFYLAYYWLKIASFSAYQHFPGSGILLRRIKLEKIMEEKTLWQRALPNIYRRILFYPKFFDRMKMTFYFIFILTKAKLQNSTQQSQGIYMEILSHTQFERQPHLIAAQVDDELVMMDNAQGIYCSLNPTGSTIWQLLESPKKYTELLESLTANYQVTSEQCDTELRHFLKKLLDARLIKMV